MPYAAGLIAAARGPRLWVRSGVRPVSSVRLVTLPRFPPQLVQAASDRAGTGVALPGGERYSCLAWVCVARQGGAQDVALCAGTSRGRVLVYAPDGELIHAQRLHDTPVRHAPGRAACTLAR